jgi:F-type H+-transporting ATPase subunit b
MLKKKDLVLLLVPFFLLQDSLLEAASPEGVGWGMLDPIGRWFNLLILLGGLIYVLRGPAKDFFANRRADIQRQLRQADKARKAAEAKLDEANRRMEGLDVEMEKIQLQARNEAEAEAERIRGQAEEESRRILAIAGREIENLGESVRQDLRQYAVDLSVHLAAEKVKSQMNEAQQAEAIDRFLDELTSGGITQ